MTRRVLAGFIQLPLLLAAAMLAVTVDWAGLTPWASWVYVGIGLVTGALACSLSRRISSLSPSAALVFAVIFFRLVDVSPVQPAIRAVSRIRVGMTENQARRILKDEFPPGGRFTPLRIADPITSGYLSFVLDPRNGKYNAAVIQVGFVHGRVASA